MSDDSGSSFGATFLGALEGAISVLLTLAAGYWVARKGMIDRDATHKVSNLCSMLFLPCLIVVQMGPELTASQLRRLWILPIWGFVSTLLAHLMGYIGYKIFKTKNWVIVASGRPNSSALPLLLLKALSTTGILDQFSSGDESSSKLLSRAQSLILLNVVVQQTFTFQIAPWLLKRDKKGQGSDGDEDDVEHGPASLTPASPGKHISNINPVVQDRERVGLLSDQDGRDYGSTEGHSGVDYAGAINPIADRPDIHWPKRIGFLEKPVKKTLGMMSPPLIGAIVALVVGLTPFLNNLFYDEDSAAYSALTVAAENLGDLFVSLQMFVVGAQLALVKNANPGVVPTTVCMLVRFIIMPGVSLLFVFLTAGRGWYTDDKLVWFLLILIPAGPSAMLLANVAELVQVDQGPIAGYLTFSYMLSPLMAVVCTLGLIVVNAASKRTS